MTLSDFRGTFFDRYSTHSYETQQKAYLLFWGCIWACLLTFSALIYALSAYHLRADHIAFKYIIVNMGMILVVSLGAYLTWHNKFQAVCYLILISINLVFLTNFTISLDRFYETGIFTHREFFYAVLAYTALFHSRKIFLVVAFILLVWPLLIPLINKPNFDSTTVHHITTLLYNGTTSFTSVALLLYFGSLINKNSLDTAEKEIAINIALNADLDQKVKDRTKELKERNDTMINIEKNLKKYLPMQLVNTLRSGRKDAIPETERRKLTVFFSDIKGFTEVTESLEAEELSSLLNEYLTAMTKIAHKWGGTVDKFIGDAIMIFFGAPERTPDKENALNCVRMAIEMQEKMKDLQDKWFNEGFENPLQIRIGISTGTSTIGNFGAEDRLSYTVIGGQVNIAARLEGICQPDEIMISHPTWAYIKHEINCTPGEKVAVKGIPRKIMTYRVAVN